jgi:hypothetical protein
MQHINKRVSWTLILATGAAAGLGLLPEVALGCLVEAAEVMRFGELVASSGAFTILP